MSLEVIGPPLPKLGPKIKVHRVKTVTPQTFVLISTALMTVYTHYHGRSAECSMESTGKCEGCEKGHQRRWKGYFDVIAHPSGERCFLELTPPACQMISLLCSERTGARGMIVEVSKTKGGAQGRFIVRSTATTVDPATLPDPIDPMPTLRVLWAWGTTRGQ